MSSNPTCTFAAETNRKYRLNLKNTVLFFRLDLEGCCITATQHRKKIGFYFFSLKQQVIAGIAAL